MSRKIHEDEKLTLGEFKSLIKNSVPKANVDSEAWTHYSEPAASVFFELIKSPEIFTEMGPFNLKPEGKLTIEELSDKYEGVLLGAAVGDAYGAPYESLEPEKIKLYYSDPNSYGVHWRSAEEIVPGDWTDDTSHSLLMADSLIRNRILDGWDLFKLLKEWDRIGFMSSTFKAFGHGKSTRVLLSNGELNLKTASWGNGATMRLAPVILFYGLREPKVTAKAAAISTLFSHAHVSCRDSALLLSLITWHFLHGYSKEEVLGTLNDPSPDLLGGFIKN